MTRKTGQPKQEAEEVLDSGFEELLPEDGYNINPSYTDKVQEFILKSNLEVGPKFYLYKYDNNQSGESKSLIAKFQDGDPPDEDDIGRRFGSGRYLTVMSIPKIGKQKGAIRAYRFKIHAQYDQVSSQTPAGYPYPAQQPYFQDMPSRKTESGVSETIAVIERLMGAFLPLMQRQENPDMQSLLFNTYDNMGNVMKKQQIENMKLMSEISRNALALPPEGGEELPTEEPEVPNVLMQLLPMISEWLPKILAGGPKAQAISSVVQQTPQFAEIIRDKRKLKSLVTYLEKTEGKEKTDLLLQKLKIKPATKKLPIRRKAKVVQPAT